MAKLLAGPATLVVHQTAMGSMDRTALAGWDEPYRVVNAVGWRGLQPAGRQRTATEAGLRLRPGCSVYRQWDGSVVGDETGKRSRPEVCPECGRVVPVRMLAIVASMDLDRL